MHSFSDSPVNYFTCYTQGLFDNCLDKRPAKPPISMKEKGLIYYIINTSKKYDRMLSVMFYLSINDL